MVQTRLTQDTHAPRAPHTGAGLGQRSVAPLGLRHAPPDQERVARSDMEATETPLRHKRIGKVDTKGNI
jgi:hypothetical protein